MTKATLYFTLFTVLLLIAGCAANRTVEKYNFPPETVLEQPFDRVWNAMVEEISSRYNVSVIDKNSGFLATEDFNPGYALSELAYSPSSHPILAENYKYSKANLVCQAIPASDRLTKIRFTAKLFAYNGADREWRRLQSNGFLEYTLIRSLRTRLTGKKFGYGLSFREIKNGKYVVYEIVNGSSADKAGIKKGDLITGINDSTVEKKPYTYIYYLLANPETNKVKLELKRDGETRVIELGKTAFEGNPTD